MGLDRCLTEKNGVFTSQSHLEESGPLLESIVAIQGGGILQFYSVDTDDLGGGIECANGRYANPISESGKDGNKPVSGTVDLIENSTYFFTDDTTATLPKVAGFTGGEGVFVTGAIKAVLSKISVQGDEGEVIISAKTLQEASDFDLEESGITFEFIFNALTNKWEV